MLQSVMNGRPANRQAELLVAKWKTMKSGDILEHDKIAELQVEVKNNRDVINEIVRVSIRVIFGDPEAKEILRNYIIKFGYPYHKVLRTE